MQEHVKLAELSGTKTVGGMYLKGKINIIGFNVTSTRF
jgi:hypothetical protein